MTIHKTFFLIICFTFKEGFTALQTLGVGCDVRFCYTEFTFPYRSRIFDFLSFAIEKSMGFGCFSFSSKIGK